MGTRDQNIAVVGCGMWGRNVVRTFAELEALRVVCDKTPLRLKDMAAQYPQIQCQTDIGSILSDEEVKAVVIVTPAATHYTVATAALQAGKHVLVEKPLALHSRDGHELVRLAEEKGLMLMVGHLLRYHPAVIKLKQLIDEGALGNIYTLYSNRLNLGRIRHEENVLWSFAPHDISVLIDLLGQMPISVAAHGGSYLQEGIADVARVTLDFPNRVLGHIFVSWLHPQKEQRLTVIGDRGMAVFDDVRTDGKLALYHGPIPWADSIPYPKVCEEQIVDISVEEPLRAECQHFLDCLEHAHTPKTDGRNGLAVLQVLEACQESMEQQGATVSVTESGLPFSNKVGIPGRSP